MKDLKEFGGFDIPFVILGNTINMSKLKKATIDRDMPRVFTEKEGGLFFEASSKNYENFEKVFLELVRRIYNSS